MDANPSWRKIRFACEQVRRRWPTLEDLSVYVLVAMTISHLSRTNPGVIQSKWSGAAYGATLPS
jgi:hypothetical protein